MDKKITFIGGGNMANSIVSGILAKGLVPASRLSVSGPHTENLLHFSQLGLNTDSQNSRAASGSDIVILAVKPQIMPTVLPELYESLDEKQLIISVAAGITLRQLESGLKPGSRIIRAMPNTPAAVCMGVTALCQNTSATIEDMADASEIFATCGSVDWVEEHLLDAVIGIAGSAPAYFFMMVEAMADAGVKSGLKRNMAYRMAAQAMAGSAELLLKSERHPGELKDQVCSPGGTTIEAVRALEDAGFRSAVITACLASTTRSQEMNIESNKKYEV